MAYRGKGAVIVQKIAAQLGRLQQTFTDLKPLLVREISKRIIHTRFKPQHYPTHKGSLRSRIESISSSAEVISCSKYVSNHPLNCCFWVFNVLASPLVFCKSLKFFQGERSGIIPIAYGSLELTWKFIQSRSTIVLLT